MALTLNEALTLGVLAAQLVVFWQQRRLMAKQLDGSAEAEERARRHDRLSVRPYLDFGSDGTQTFLKVVLENHGAGPAIGLRIEAFVNGESVSPNPRQVWPWPLLRALGLEDRDLDVHAIQRGFITMPTAHLRPGGQIQVLDLHFSGTKDVRELCRKLTFEVRYESIYRSEDEPFVARLDWSGIYFTT